MSRMNKLHQQIFNRENGLTEEQQDFIADLLKEAYELGVEYTTNVKLDLEWDCGYNDGFETGKNEGQDIAVNIAMKRILEKSDKI